MDFADSQLGEAQTQTSHGVDRTDNNLVADMRLIKTMTRVKHK